VLTKLLLKRLPLGANDWLGNAAFWVSFCIFGQPICVLLYLYQYNVASGAGQI
jgi:hypothetical protein